MEPLDIEIPECPSYAYETCDNDCIVGDMKEFLGKNKEVIYNFVYNNQKEIKGIYNKIKDRECRNVRVSAMDANMALHTYKSYLTDMIAFFNEFCEKSSVAEGKVGEVINSMIEKDSNFFDTVSEKSECTVEEAMQNIELLIDINSFIDGATEDLKNGLSNLCGDDDVKKGFASLYANSVSSFISKLVSGIIGTFEEISTAIEVGTKMSLESAKARPYKLI